MSPSFDENKETQSQERQEAGAESKTPQRRCICCRANGKKYTLLRFAVIQGEICFDLRKKLPGRGFYVCAQRHCLEKAFGGAFKRIVKAKTDNLGANADEFIESMLIPGLRKRYTECLLAGMRSGRLILGAEGVEQSSRHDELACYVLATDASESTKQKYRMNAGRKHLPCIGLLDRAFLGHLFGKSDKVVLGWQACQLCEECMQLEASIRRLEGLQEIENLTASDKG